MDHSQQTISTDPKLRRIVANAIGETIAGPQTPPFKPYKGLDTAHAMRAFCRHIRDHEQNVRRGRHDRALYAWLNPDEFEGES